MDHRQDSTYPSKHSDNLNAERECESLDEQTRSCLENLQQIEVDSSALSTMHSNEEHSQDCENKFGIGVLLQKQHRACEIQNPKAGIKRARTAEVHNNNERRRRDKLNDRMKQLQALVPNSIKTDKISILDEAIDYMKSLQCQLQEVTLERNFFGRQLQESFWCSDLGAD